MRAVLGLILLVVLCGTGFAYDNKRVVASVQEALVRLGYDPGPVDGAWGKKSREALNSLRAREALPPADGLTGSSLALVHRLSPGDTTLPRPGYFFVDIHERRAFLSQPENAALRRAQCPTRIGAGDPLSQFEPRMTIGKIVKRNQYISDDEDWYSPILESLMGAVNSCMSGDNTGNDMQCKAVADFILRWAEADALVPTVGRDYDDYAQVIWTANVVLRNFIVAYGMVRQLVDIAPEDDMLALDWFKRRVDDFHYYAPRHLTTNHAIADMSPALAYGVLVGDRTMMEPAFVVWREALASMRKDGSLPMESRRGARWAHYTNLQISQLMFVAELAASQDIDLYGQSPPGQTVQRAVSWLFDGLEDFDVARPYAKENHGSPGDYRIPYLTPYQYGWLPTYHARFGNDEVLTRIKTATIDARICSPEAMEEEKAEGPACRGFQGKPLSFRDTLTVMKPMPNHHMGYSAGCVQGTVGFALAD